MINRLFSTIFKLPPTQRVIKYWLLAAFISLLFIFGGSSRSDAASLIAIRPITILALVFGIYCIRRDDAIRFKWHIVFMAAFLLLTFVHILPLPWTVWQGLGGGSLSAEIIGSAGLPEAWQPFSLAPNATWNSLSALMVPAAVLMLAISFERESQFRIVGVFLVIGLINAILGFLQAIGSPDSPLYFYQIRAGNFPSGFFANRNHYAVFLSCIIPMLAVYWSSIRASSRDNGWKVWLAIAFGTMLIPLVLVTGSRAGLLTAVIGMSSAPFLYRPHNSKGAHAGKASGKLFIYIVSTLGFTAMALLTIFASRAESLARLLDDGGSTTSRISIWQPISDMMEKYRNFGSGAGSFAQVYQIGEPVSALTFQYVPHAHNDWLELAFTTGWPGVMFMICFVIAYVYAVKRHFRADIYDTSEVLLGRLGVVVIGLLILGSTVDYPLRTPALAGLFVVASVWALSSTRLTTKKGGGT